MNHQDFSCALELINDNFTGMQRIDYLDPATTKPLGQIEITSPERVQAALEKAREAFKIWSTQPLQRRLDCLEKGKIWLIENIEDVVAAISLNNGKPKVESLMADVAPVIQSVNFYKRNAEKILRDESVSIWRWLPTKKAYISYSPLGVVGIISPWNYPFSIPMGEILSALVAGNAVLLKPSEITGHINIQIQKFIDACDLPDGVFQMLNGDGTTGAALTNSPLDRLIFTGSVATGKKVMKAAAENLVPVSLELGGKDPCIVFDDANIDIASSGVVVGGYYNNGQTCCSIERLLVHKKIEDKFISAVKTKLDTLRVGPSTGYDNELGPITYSPQKKIIKQQLDAHGSGKLYDGVNNFIKPALVKSSEKDLIWNEETFGPVIVYDTFDSDSEAIEKANRNNFGLGAVVWSGNSSRAQKVAKQLYTGTVIINDAPYTNAIAALPWGGVKHSGMGKVHGKEGLRDMCLSRVITYDLQGQAKQIWWFPYSFNHYAFLKAFALFTSETRVLNKISWFFRMIASALKLEKRL